MTQAMSQTQERELGFEEYMQTPETNLRRDVIDGVIMMSPSPTFHHQLILLKLGRDFSDHVEDHNLGTVVVAPADLLIRKDPKLRVRQPDLMFISRARAGRDELKQVQILEIAPDLAVEILSPSETKAHWAEKLADYASIRIPELWRIDPETESVEVYALAEGGYSLECRFVGDDEIHSHVVPGLALRVRSLFA